MRDTESTSPNRRNSASLDSAFLPGALADRSNRRALNSWHQGDLVRNIRLFWATPTGEDPLTGLTVDDLDDGLAPVVGWDGEPALEGDPAHESDEGASDPTDSSARTWAIITSQTCDVVASGPGARHFTVQVSPLRDLSGTYDKGQITQIRRGANVDLVYVNNVPEPGDWAADLRISLPVSKGILIQQEPTPGFGADSQSQQFAERVAAKYRRPALHDEISDGLVNGLRNLIETSRKADDIWPDSIEQFRILVLEGDRLNPRHVVVLALTLDKLSPMQKGPLRKWRTTERRRLAKVSDGIQLGPIRFVDVDDLKVRDYRSSDPLRIPELGGPTFW